MGNEKKRSSLLRHTWVSLAFEAGFCVPAPIPTGRPETRRSRFPRRHLSAFSARVWVQKGYFKIKPCLPCSNKPRAQLRVLFPFLQLFTALQVERARSLAETRALASSSFIWQPRRAGTKGEGETTRKEAQFLLLLLQHTRPSAPEGYLDQYPKQQKGNIISCWLAATI